VLQGRLFTKTAELSLKFVKRSFE